MTDQLQGTLASAYELIEADQLDEARSLLKPILADNPDNADAWWLYAHAVDDPEAARTALNNVLRLDREYPGAAALMGDLEQAYPAGAPAVTAEPLTEPDLFALDSADSLNLADELEDDELFPEAEADFDEVTGDTAPVQTESSRKRTNWPLILLLLLLIAVVIALLLLSRGGGDGGSQQPALAPTVEAAAAATEDVQGQPVSTPATEAAAASTENAQDQQPVPTSETAVEAVVSDGEAAAAALVESALTDAAMLPSSARVESTTLGQTMLVSVCTTAGDEMRAALGVSMGDLSTVAAQMGAAADAVGVRLVNCETEQTLRIIGAPVDAAVRYAGGALDRSSYEASWRALP